MDALLPYPPSFHFPTPLTARYMYKNGEAPAMPTTERIIQFTVDLRLPPRFTDAEFDKVADCLVAGFQAAGAPSTA